MTETLRAIWPIHDLAPDLIPAAEAELPTVAARAHARITGPVRWHILPGSEVPGAAAYQWVLVALAPAEPRPLSNVELARLRWREAQTNTQEAS